MKHALPLFATPAVPVSTMRGAMPGRKNTSIRESIELELDDAYAEMQEEAELEHIRATYACKASRRERLDYLATY